jgi:small subunit ribosomal protein S1
VFGEDDAMGSNQNKLISKNDDETMTLDEGWWSSILSDEEAAITSRSDNPAKNNSHSSLTVDWNSVRSCFEQDEVIEMEVYGYNRGGILVQCDRIQGFVPVSHLVDIQNNPSEDERNKVLAHYVGRQVRLKVIECEPNQERVVFSERAALAGEGRRRQIFQTLKIGTQIEGVVTNLTEFGAFVDLGGVEGLIHVSELSWGRVSHPSEVLKIGDRVNTMVLQVAEESARVALSMKRLVANPWEQLSKHVKPGDVVSATITAIMRFGAFARLEAGVEGLIHISSMDLPGGRKQIEQILKIGQPVQVRILHVDSERRRLGLGLVKS